MQKFPPHIDFTAKEAQIGLETESAALQGEYLVRAQIPPGDVPACWPPSRLQVRGGRPALSAGQAFRSSTGALQFKPLAGSKEGQTGLYQLPSDEISFTIPVDEETLASVIEATLRRAGHPC